MEVQRLCEGLFAVSKHVLFVEVEICASGIAEGKIFGRNVFLNTALSANVNKHATLIKMYTRVC